MRILLTFLAAILSASLAHAEDTGLREILRLFAERQATAWTELRDALTPEPEPPPTPKQLTLTHLGTNRLPSWGVDPQYNTPIYSNGVQRLAAVHGKTDEAWITWQRVTRGQVRHVGRLSLPATAGTDDPRNSPAATWLQTPVKVGQEFENQVVASVPTGAGWAWLNGVADDGEKLHLNFGQYYQVQTATYRNYATISRDLDIATEVFRTQPSPLGTPSTGGWISLPPAGWSMDGLLIRGNYWQNGDDGGPRSSVVNMGFNPPDKFTSSYSPTNKVDDTWSTLDSWNSLVFFDAPDGQKLWGFVVCKGTAPGWYGGGTSPTGVVDQCSSSQGRHAYPYQAEIWLFKHADMLAVLNGAAAHTPKPVRKIALPEFGTCGRILGADIVGDRLVTVHGSLHFATTRPTDIERINYLRSYRIGWE